MEQFITNGFFNFKFLHPSDCHLSIDETKQTDRYVHKFTDSRGSFVHKSQLLTTTYITCIV